MKCEILNQKLCRMLLSVHKRCSRLATLGELGRYPLLISCIKHCLKYEWHLGTLDQDSVVCMAVKEMAKMPELDTWLSRVNKIKSLLNIRDIWGSHDRVSKTRLNYLNVTTKLVVC